MSILISRRTALASTLGLALAASAGSVEAARSTRADRIWAALMARSPDRTFVQAHRGNHEAVPENSLRAIDEAIRSGADIVELDVRRTRDGVLVVLHDRTINRTMSGAGAVADLSYDALQALRLRGPGGAIMNDRIPTFEAALRRARGRVLVTVDIKVERLEDVPPIVEAVARTGLAGRVLYYADDLSALDIVHRLDSAAVTLPLAAGPNQIDGLVARFASPALHLKPDYLTPALVDGLRGRGLITLANALHPNRTATDDIDAGYDALVASGLAIIQTNRPTDLIAELARRGRHVKIP